MGNTRAKDREDYFDLDLRKPGICKPYKRNEFETTSEEVLRKADFRVWIFMLIINLISVENFVKLIDEHLNGFLFFMLERQFRFLANFITEAGIIIKRSKTGISAKAQRKITREIKTARAFGLMPFTTMGTKQFVYGKTMEDLDEDHSYETYDRNFEEDEVEI
ncbi:uncharacterized protein LOC111398226 [Olea europaea var. sylvestris]|uniref:uncharacterized protein LOC111398226 n=1 Tax=Olea europaea var. sylvestris TaxID=158386 RepID=UPI000C1CEC1D|nr:uncharacterized protein LOC111398226 [Olea europaea var. sylvestris]